MDAFFAKSRSQRSVLCEQVGDQLGIAPGAVEKDFWVCWILRELFRLDVGPHLAFKGGTSLSKCWGVKENITISFPVGASPFDVSTFDVPAGQSTTLKTTHRGNFDCDSSPKAVCKQFKIRTSPVVIVE